MVKGSWVRLFLMLSRILGNFLIFWSFAFCIYNWEYVWFIVEYVEYWENVSVFNIGGSL